MVIIKLEYLFHHIFNSSCVNFNSFNIFFCKEDLLDRFQKLRANPKKLLWNHLKKYWFIYTLVILFATLSIFNTVPYLWANYHDDYYIAKMVNLVGSPHLLDENYVNGAKLIRNSFFSYPLQQGYRSLNTYELTYAYLGTLFQINIPFFCRFTLVIYMYFLVFLTYQIFVEKFIGDNNYSQYALIFFSLLMIPSGFMSSIHHFSIRMFENWRFQTAIYFGGSFVRVLGLPLLILSFSHLCEKFDRRSISTFIAIILVLLSFQVTIAGYLMFILPIFIVVFILNRISKRHTRRNYFELCIIICFIFLLIVLLSNILIEYLPFNTSKYNNYYDIYHSYYNDIFICDMFALTGFIPTMMLSYLYRKNNSKFLPCIIILFCYLMFRLNAASKYICLISNYTFYVTLRIITSILLLIVCCWGIFVVQVIYTFVHSHKVARRIAPLINLILVVAIFVGIVKNDPSFTKYIASGQGMTPIGYSKETVLNNDKMLPNSIVEVGDYFNKLPYGNYKLLSSAKIPYKSTYIDNVSFMMASNRIELWMTTQNYQMDDYKVMTKFLNGTIPYYVVDYIFKKYNLKYVFTTKQICKDQLLLNNNFKVILGNKEKKYWLMKAVS